MGLLRHRKSLITTSNAAQGYSAGSFPAGGSWRCANPGDSEGEHAPREQRRPSFARALDRCEDSVESREWVDLSCGWPWAGFASAQPRRLGQDDP